MIKKDKNILIPEKKIRLKKTVFYVCPILLIICLFILIFVTELKQLSDTTDEIHDNMKQNLNIKAQLMSNKLMSVYTFVEAVAPEMAFDTQNSKKEMLIAMSSLHDACGFDFVERTDIDGTSFDYQGLTKTSFSDAKYIGVALDGGKMFKYFPAVAGQINDSCIIMAVPITYNDKVVGVLSGGYYNQSMKSLFSELGENFYQDSMSVSVVDSDYNIIYSEEANSDRKDFLDILYHEDSSKYSIPKKIQKDFANSKNDLCVYSHNNLKQYFYYSKINTEHPGEQKWFVVTKLDETHIREKTEYARYATNLIILMVLIVIFIFVFLIVKEQKLIDDMERRAVLLSESLATAEKASELKKKFLSNISHEMRTPLNAIIGFLDLAKTANEKQLKTYLANSEIAAKQLVSVINDVLDISSIESGKMKIAHVPFDFRQLIHSITNIYVMQCNEKGIKYETKILTPINESLIGDQMRVSQILINLLGNSVKFTSEGYILLSVSQKDIDDNNVSVQFIITDTGCGMSDEMQKRMFNPFEQESSTTASKYGGSGLGLSIVKNLVNVMGGQLQVQSKPESGTTFIIELPFEKNDPKNNAGTSENVKTLHVLALDDDEAELNYISLVLKRTGVRFTCMSGREKAIDELIRAEKENDHYNICLIDWKMPFTESSELTKCIRDMYGSDVMIIIVSAYDYNMASDKAKESGADKFISKPLFQSSLFDLFMNITGGEIADNSVSVINHNFSNKRVLVVEDNVMNQMVVEEMLKRFGIECEKADDGSIAVEMFSNSPDGYYDAILMDIQMPNMNGIDATKAIRSSLHINAGSIPIIALTANAFSEDIAKTLSAGMNAHVAKPINPTELSETLENMFKK